MTLIAQDASPATSRSRPLLSAGPFSAQINWRVIGVCLALAAGGLVIFTASIAQGDYPLSFADVWRTLCGGGTLIENRIVIDVRLGRALLGLAVGAALGMAGAVTQSVARNPLASPDVLGLTQGASLAAVTVLSFAGTSGALGQFSALLLSGIGVPAAAFCGALFVAVAVWFIAGSARGSVLRFVLIGVAVGTLCSSLSTWVMAVGELDRVAGARLWLTGSLVGRGLSELWPILAVLCVALLLAPYLSFQLSALVLGETTATMLGHNVRVAQAAQLLIAVLLTAVAVAAAGPVGFVAFVSPHIALRLAGAPSPPLVTSALTGAVLVSTADFLARVALPWELPVGIVTTVAGAPVLIALIVHLNRKAP